VTRGWAAVKTGTSKDMRDNWCIGFSDRYTVGVWVGNATGDAMRNVSGVHGAAPVWNEVMVALHAGRPSQAPRAPDGLERKHIGFAQQREPQREEWFVAGTQRTSIALSTSPQPAIVTPADGSIIALDPDIPPPRQRLTLNATGVRDAAWRVDGTLIGKGIKQHWMPQPGTHRISLHDAAGSEIAQVQVQVRGAFPKVTAR
jgi:penicillin-binding protein 1C